MIVLPDQTGWLANRIFLYSHIIVFSEANDIEVFYPGFNEYAGYFEKSSLGFNCRYPPRKSFIRLKTLRKFSYRFFYLLCHILIKIQKPLFWTSFISRSTKIVCLKIGEIFDLELPANCAVIKLTPISILTGWGFRSGKEAFLKQQHLLISYFTPVRAHRDNIENLFVKITTGGVGAIIVGVHIRRGDYKTFEGGKYFFEWKEYAFCMQQFRNSMPGKRVVFLICSNEAVPYSFFESQQLEVFAGTRDKVEDMYALAKCNYIMGPPSTYSLWASFYGNVPIYLIRDLKLSFSEMSFLLPQEWMR